MANLLFRLTATLVDDEDVKASTLQYALVPEAVTGTQLSALLNAWATAVNGITDGGFANLEVALVLAPDSIGLPVTAHGSEEASENGEFQYNLTGTQRTWTSAIPTLSEAVVLGNSIDTTNTAIIALNTLITGAILTTGNYCSPDGRAVASRKATFLGTRKHRRQQHAKSYILG